MFEWMEKGWGYDVVLWFQSWRTDFISAIFKPFDWVGTEFFFIFLIAIIYWLIDKRKGRLLASVFLLSMWFNSFFKTLFTRPRPYQVEVLGKEKVLAAYPGPSSYGLPSGHTQSAASFFTLLPMYYPKKIILSLSIFMIIVVPVSRLIHGMHYPQDIILGYILSFGICISWYFVQNRFLNMVSKYKLKFLIPFSAIFIVALYAFSFLPLLNANNGLVQIEDNLSVTTLFLGGICGMFFERYKVSFKVKDIWWKLVLRFLIGIVLLVVFKLGFDFAFAPFEPKNHNEFSLIFFIGDFLEKFVLSFWILGGAPAVFVLFGLADKEVSANKSFRISRRKK